MSYGAARTHFCCNPDGFHDLLFRGLFPGSSARMALDAVGTLGYMGHRHRDKLFSLRVQSTVLKYGPTELAPGLFDVWGKTFAPLARGLLGHDQWLPINV
jgi:hypothetical protein